MKVKAFQIPLLLLILDFCLSIPAVASVVNIRVGSVSFLGTYRFGALILLMLSLFLVLKKNRFFTQKKRLIFPALILLILSVFQALALTPRSLAMSHLRGLTRIFFWLFSYLTIVATLTPKSEERVRRIFLGFLTFLFVITLIQYPILIVHSKISIGSVLSALLQGDKIKVFGIFRAANEDANFMMTVFPFGLLLVERMRGIKRKVFKYGLILSTLLALLLNGTRTAVFCTLPIVLFIYYSKLSAKRIFLATFLVIFAASAYSVFAADLLSGVFSDELEDGGSFGYRLEHAWIPAVTYTLRYSPFFGFGARGWEHLNEQIRLFDVVNEWGVIQGSAAPHNVYVWVLVTWGAIGLITYLAFILILLRQSFLLFKSRKLKAKEDRDTGKALFCSVCAYSLWGFISNAHAPVGWMTFFMVASLTASLETKALSQKNTSDSESLAWVTDLSFR